VTAVSDEPGDGGPRSGVGQLLLWSSVGLVIWVIAAGLVLATGYREARQGRDGLVALAEAEPLDLDIEGTRADLRRANGHLSAARSRLESPVLWPLRPVPVMGRQLASARALAGAGDRTTEALDALLDQVALLGDGSSGSDRATVLRQLEGRLAEVEAVLADLDLGPDEALVAPLGRARDEFALRRTELQAHVQRGQLVAGGLASFFEGSRYLLLGANNAEMLLASGMHLSLGELRVQDGELAMSDLESAEDLFPVEGVSILDADVEARWGAVHGADDFRQLAFTARFAEVIGPQALAMWEAETGDRLDGVLALDPTVLQALLRTTGPVTVDGETFDADNLLPYLLVEQYGQFEGDDLKTARRDRLSDIAQVVLAELGSRTWDPMALLRDLEPVARAGRVRVWSTIAEHQAAWAALDVDGRLTGDELGVFLLNAGGSKLDPFIALDVEADVVSSGVDQATLRLDISVRNDAPADLPDYAVGPWERIGLSEPGTYLARLAVYAPGRTREVRFVPSVPLDALGPDGPVTVIATRVALERGETARFRLELDLAGGTGAPPLVLLPSARIPAATWTWAGEAFLDDSPVELPLATGPRFDLDRRVDSPAE
jgi:hypothetical protein